MLYLKKKEECKQPSQPLQIWCVDGIVQGKLHFKIHLLRKCPQTENASRDPVKSIQKGRILHRLILFLKGLGQCDLQGGNFNLLPKRLKDVIFNKDGLTRKMLNL